MLFGLLIILGSFLDSPAQVTIFPDVERRTDESVQIIKIEVTDIFTIVDMLYIAEAEDYWICADKNFYIQPGNSSDRKYLIMAKEIPLCPDRKKISTGGEEFEFQLYFPGLDTSVLKIDVIEKPVSGFNFFGVWLDKNNPRPQPDSLSIASRDECQTYFENREDNLKPLEGIWNLTIKQAKYHGEIFLEYLDDDPEILDAAVIWKADHYECYGMDGKSIEMQFNVLAEGGRYAFREYFREVKEEVTTFVYMDEKDIIKYRFNVPRRWASYLLSGKLFDSENLVKDMSWKRTYPGMPEK